MRLNELLVERNTTMYRLARELGVSDNLVGYWCKAKNTPTLDKLIKIADYFDVSIDYLVGRSDNPARQ